MANDSKPGTVASGSDLEATVMFEYSSQEEGELSLNVGNIIKDVVELNDVWCSGVVGGRSGIFPRNFVKLSDKTKRPTSTLRSETLASDNRKYLPLGTKPIPISHAEKHHGKRKHDKSQVAKLMSVSPARAKVITSSLASAVATSSSSAFIVHQQQSNFSPMKEKELGQSLPPHSKKVHTPPVTQQDVQITLVSPKEPKTKTQSVGASGSSNIKIQTIEKATVKVAYDAVDEDEISAQVGDTIDVISKVTEDEGWWKVRLGEKEGLFPAIFLETPGVTVEDVQESTEWLTLIPPDNEKVDTPASTVSHTEISTSGWCDNQQVAVAQTVTQTANEIQSAVNFPCDSIRRALLLDPKISTHIDQVAKLHNVIVSPTQDRLSQVVLSGSPQGVVCVHNEISTLASQVKRDIKAHCMLLPILLSHQAIDVITIIRERYGIEVNLATISGLLQPIQDVIQAGRQIQLLQKVQIRVYLIPSVSVSELYIWSFINKHSVLELLPPSVNELLNNWYRLQISGQKQFQFNSVSYIADLSAMTLMDTMTGEIVSLYKELQSPYWSFAQDQQGNFLNFVQSDSDSIESMYRYGGSSITLSGANHLIEFTSMHHLNLSTGKTFLIKRCPPPLSSVLPDYTCHLVLTGSPDSLNEVTTEVMKQLDTLCTLTEFTCKLPGISQHWRDVIAVHAFNVFRQFCVKVGNLQVSNGVLVAELQGEREYCEKVKVHVKEQLLDLLQSVMTQESSLRSSPSAKMNFPPEWEPQQLDVEFKSVSKNSQEWNDIVGMVHKTLPTTSVVQIDRIQHRQLWEKYALEKSHMNHRNNSLVNEELLFHGTRKNNPRLVAESLRGIDFRCSRRDHQLLWGTGAYFAANACYSNRYSYYNTQLQAWQMIIVKVLTGNTCKYRNPIPSLTRPPPLFTGSNLLYDTVCGQSGGSDIYVVYDQDRAYPAYIVSYRVPRRK